MGATNFPEDIDKAVLSRFQKRIYLKLPDKESRKKMIINELEKRNSQKLEKEQFKKIVKNTENYSYRDFKNLFKDVDQIIIKKLSVQQIKNLKKGDMFPIKFEILDQAVKNRGIITTNADIKKYEALSPQNNLKSKDLETESSSEEEHGLLFFKN